MSYRCTISFKIIEPTELYSFLLQYKQECLKNYVNIAEENCLCSPVWRENQDTSFIDLKTLENADELEQKTEIWAKNHVFKYRWFYLVDKKLLGIYAVPTSVYHLFDSTLQFQNSCDQDYDYDIVIDNNSTEADLKEVANIFVTDLLQNKIRKRYIAKGRVLN